MTRKSTIVWIVSAVVVVGVGVAVAVPSLANSHGKVTSAVTPVDSPSADGPTAVASSPSTGATPSASVAPADPASPSASSSASASPTSKPVVTVKNVTPHLTYYDWTSSTTTLEVGGNVPGLVDAGGSCVVTATHGSVTVSQAFPASAQASSTECGTMRLTSPKLTAGTWNLTIGYRSPRATGTSASTEVTL